MTPALAESEAPATATPVPAGATEAQPAVHTPDQGADTAGQAPAAPDWQQAIESGDLDIEAVLRHPKVAGKVGRLAQQQAQAALAENDRRARENRLDEQARQRLADDPDDELARARLANSVAATAEQQTQQVKSWLTNQLTTAGQAAYQEAFEARGWNEKPIDALSFVELVGELADKHPSDGRVKAFLSTPAGRAAIKAEAAAQVKEQLGETVGTEPVPDTDSGRMSTGLTWEGYNAMSTSERQKLNPSDIDAMMATRLRAA